MNIKAHILQLGRFAVAGVVATLIHLMVATALIYFFQTSVFIANTLAFFSAFVFSYIAQTMFVFRAHFQVKKFMKFFIVQYGAFLVSFLISELIPIENGYVQTILIILILPLLTFFMHKFWTFEA